jgi:hypothetical protein
MYERDSISILIALDMERENGRLSVAAELLADCMKKDMDSLFELLDIMSEAGWIEIAPATEFAPYAAVSLKRGLGEISLYEVMALEKEPRMEEYMRSVLRDIPVLDMKNAIVEHRNRVKEREYAERMLARMVAEYELFKETMNTIN